MYSVLGLLSFQLSLFCMATFVICSQYSLLLAFSPIFFTSLCLSYLSSHNPPILAIGGLPRFLQPSCFLSHIFSAISSLLFLPCVQSISASSSANYTRSSFDFFSYVFHFPSLHSVYTGCSPCPVVLIYLSVMLF